PCRCRTGNSSTSSPADLRLLNLLSLSPSRFHPTIQQISGGRFMRTYVRCFTVFLLALLLQAVAHPLFAQSAGNSGTITGTVTDASGAVIPGAAVTIENPVSGLDRKAITDATGQFQFTNLPLNPYHLTTKKDGFTALVQDVEVRSFVPISLKLALQVGTAATTVTVTGED